MKVIGIDYSNKNDYVVAQLIKSDNNKFEVVDAYVERDDCTLLEWLTKNKTSNIRLDKTTFDNLNEEVREWLIENRLVGYLTNISNTYCYNCGLPTEDEKFCSGGCEGEYKERSM